VTAVIGFLLYRVGMLRTVIGDQTVTTDREGSGFVTVVLPVASGDAVCGEYDDEVEARSGHAAIVGRMREFLAASRRQT
jgi:hypothetical protein